VRKIVVSEFLSLDGVAEQPSDFITSWDESVDEYGAQLISTQDTVLLGRRTYDEWYGFWPHSEIEPFSSFINNVEKYVATSSTPNSPWAHTTFVETELPRFVAELKQRPGNDIGVHGSISLSQSLLDNGLVDELRLCVAPTLHHRGRKLFEGQVSRALKLVRHEITSSGFLLLDYEVNN
jgi:dihydrofolate reductase